MAITYSTATKEVREVFEKATLEANNTLNEHEVMIDIIAVQNLNLEGDSIGHCVKANGTFVVGKTRIVPLRERLSRENSDADVIIDIEWWDDSSLTQRLAYAKSLIRTIGVKYDKDGVSEVDDLGRTKLQIRKPDFVIVGTYADMLDEQSHAYQSYDALKSKLLEMGN